MGRRLLLLGGVASLLPLVCRGQRPCTANIWATRAAEEHCIDEAVTPLLEKNALWEYRCPIEGGVAADFSHLGSEFLITTIVPDGSYVAETDGNQQSCAPQQMITDATQTAVGCAAACDQQAQFQHHMSAISDSACAAVPFVGVSADQAACVAFLWSGGSCMLFSNAIGETISPNPGTFYYRRNAPPNPGYLADGVSLAGPGTCGCPSATLFEDRCVVLCESSTCVRVPDEELDDSFAVLVKTGTGSCRGAGGSQDRAEEDLTVVDAVATPAECMALCTTADCYGVTIQTLAAINDDVCDTLPSAACELANANAATCTAASTADSPCTYNENSGTCTATPDDNCSGHTTAEACEAAGRCTLRSDPVNSFVCEIWDKVEIQTGARAGTKVRVVDIQGSEQYKPIRPMHQAGDLGQCWVPLHVAHMCEVPAGPSVVTTANPLNNGVVAEICSEGMTVTLGQQTCIECDAFFGPDPDTADAICNPKYGVIRSQWFEAGDTQCMPECADNDQQLSECREWASKDECATNPYFMDNNCPYSCRTWLKEDSTCIEPMDPNEAILLCTPCPTEYYDGEPYDCKSYSALDVPSCRAYGLSRTGSMSDVARVYVEDQGWRDIPLGAENPDEHLNQCEDMRLGPNFGQLGVPIPPNSVGLPDRYTVECEQKRIECSSYHRSSRSNCDGDNYYLNLRLNFFMDCVSAAGQGCRASENYMMDGKPGYPPKYCNRGIIDTDDPPHGFHWSIPLCKTTPECLVAGAAVLSDPDSLEVFRRDCCMLSTAAEVETGPDGTTTMRNLCARVTSGAPRATVPSWLRLVWATLAALMIYSHATR